MKIDNKPQNTKVNEAILPNNSSALYTTIIQHMSSKRRRGKEEAANEIPACIYAKNIKLQANKCLL